MFVRKSNFATVVRFFILLVISVRIGGISVVIDKITCDEYLNGENILKKLLKK